MARLRAFAEVGQDNRQGVSYRGLLGLAIRTACWANLQLLAAAHNAILG